MLTLLGTEDENNNKTSAEYYYYHYHSQPHYQPYCPLSFDNNNDNPNAFHYSSIHDTNPYYTFTTDYTSPPNTSHPNSIVSNNSLYLPTCHQQYYSSDEHTNTTVYPQTQSSLVTTTEAYNDNVSLNSNYIQPSSVEQTHCSTSHPTNYSVSYSGVSTNGLCRSDCVVVELVNRPLWLRFVPHILENIITKPGRRMFPTLEFKVYGLKPNAMYDVYVEMVLVDDHHWKFHSGQWIPSGQVEQSQKTNQHCVHPDSPNSGAHWMKNDKISFSKLKLTNNKQLVINNQQNQMTVLLNSMHKYMPRLNIVEINHQSTDLTLSSSSSTNGEVSKHTFTFDETEFIAVTAYQNTDITELKINHNPFAKGFRDSCDHQNAYNVYSYGSPSPPYGSENNVVLDYSENTYEHQQPRKKKRHQ